MSVRFRRWKSGASWQIDVDVKGKRARCNVPARSKAEAEDMEAQVRAALIEGRPVPIFDIDGKVKNEAPKAITLTDLAKKREEQARKPSTAIKWAQVRRLYLGCLADKAPADVTAGDLVKLSRDLGEKLADNTLWVTLGYVRQLIRDGGTVPPPNPVPHVDVRRPPAPVDDVQAVFNGTDDVQLRAAIQLAVGLGLRRGEIVALTWADVDLRTGTIHIHRTVSGGKVTTTKGATDHWQPLPAPVRAALEALPHREGPLVGITYHALGGRLERACKAAGVPNFGTHRQRHTLCTGLADAGVPLHVAMQVSRHKDPRSFTRYTHARASQVRAALDAVQVIGVAQRPAQAPGKKTGS